MINFLKRLLGRKPKPAPRPMTPDEVNQFWRNVMVRMDVAARRTGRHGPVTPFDGHLEVIRNSSPESRLTTAHERMLWNMRHPTTPITVTDVVRPEGFEAYYQQGQQRE